MEPPPPPPPPPPPADCATSEFHSKQTAHPDEEATFAEHGFAPAPVIAPPRPQTASRLMLIPLCRKGDRSGIEHAILNGGASVEEVDIEGNTPLHVAVEAPRNEVATVSCLLENMANPNTVNYIGAAPLHYVCLRKSNWRGIANLLLEYGANIDCQTLAGKSALHFACENQLPELVEVLCLFGADPHLLDVQANTAMHLALAKEGGRDTVKRQILECLLNVSANVEVRNLKGMSPMHLACSTGCIRCVQLLMEMKANPGALTSRWESGLHLACTSGHTEVTQLFVQTVPQLIDAQDIDGNTPLHAASYAGNLDCALILLRNGAEPEVKNHGSLSAYDVSKVKGQDLASTHNPELVQAAEHLAGVLSCQQEVPARHQ
ncbi:Ank3 [Symbiodinium sp. CCMP2592]|nr:Ank3 [Symbiodinium sp. CCMP2592]